MTRKKNKMNKFLNKLIVLNLVIFFLSIFFLKSQLSSVNIETERLKKKISKQEKINESLTMKVNELVSLENMQLVALESGLEYNNNNVIVIKK